MKRVELTVPIALLEDLGVLTERFSRHNESVEVLQTFSVRPQVAALFVRVRRRGPFKAPGVVRREAGRIAKRYRLERFEVLSADPRRGEYVAWIEYPLPAILREGATGGLAAGVVALEVARGSPKEARGGLLASASGLAPVRGIVC